MVVCEMWIKHWRKKNVSLLLLHGDYLIMISNENTRWLTVALEKIKNCATMENSESTALHCVNESDFFLLCVCYIIVLKMPEIKNGILFPRFAQPLWSASRNLTTKGKPLLIHFIVKSIWTKRSEGLKAWQIARSLCKTPNQPFKRINILFSFNVVDYGWASNP